LAGAEAAVDAAFEKAGIIRAYTSEQLFDWAKALANLPLPAGRNVAILTNAGGPGVIAADALADNNFALSRLDPFTIAALQQRLPPAASAQNPVDMLASATADDYAACLNALLADVQTHAVMVIIPPSPISPTVKIAQALIPIIKASDKPVLPIVMGSMLIHETLLEFSRSDIPCYSFPEKAASSLACLADRADFLMNMHEVTLPPPGFDAQAITGTLSGIQPGTDDPIAGFRVMESIGIPTAPVRLATSRAEAGVISQQLGFPLVAKIASPDISHKSDVGGVLMNLMSTADALDAFDALLSRAGEKMPSARLDGVTLQKQILNGQEVILGFARDPQFGHLVMFGSGGIDVEGLKDITFNLAPLTQREAEKMISRTWAGRKLSGFRNLPPVDRHATVEALVKLSWLAYRFPEITECEINPLKVLQQGVIAVDVRIKLQDL
jgi:acetyltransferase